MQRRLAQSCAQLPAVVDRRNRGSEPLAVYVAEERVDHPRLSDVVLSRTLRAEGAGSDRAGSDVNERKRADRVDLNLIDDSRGPQEEVGRQ